MIIDLHEPDTWKIQLRIAINFISSNDTEKDRVMHSKNDNIKSATYNNANEVVDELFDSLGLRYQGNLETSMEVSKFIFDSVQMMHSYNFWIIHYF